MDGQFSAKMPKYENCSISETVNPIKQNHMPMTVIRSKPKPEVKFQYDAAVCFQKPEVLISRPCIESWCADTFFNVRHSQTGNPK